MKTELNDVSYYFDLKNFQHRALFEDAEYIFDAIKRLPNYLKSCAKSEIRGTVMQGAFVDDNVDIGEGTIVQPGAWVRGPTIIGKHCEIRHGAYVGSYTLTGDEVVIGHASETGNAILLNGARAPHFAFVGHSILGNKVNLGAGTKLSNLKVTFKEIKVESIQTGLTKLGAIIGDHTSLGCNTVTQPATFIGKHVYSYPLALLRGFIPSKTIVKVRQTQEMAEYKDDQ